MLPPLAILRTLRRLVVRDGKVVRWREYQDILGMALALGQLPGLLAGIGDG